MADKYWIHTHGSKQDLLGPSGTPVIAAMLEEGTISTEAVRCKVGDEKRRPLGEVIAPNEVGTATNQSDPRLAESSAAFASEQSDCSKTGLPSSEITIIERADSATQSTKKRVVRIAIGVVAAGAALLILAQLAILMREWFPDKVQQPFKEAEALASDEPTWELALAKYQEAVRADPSTDFGKQAAEKIPVMQKLLDTIPTSVSESWCARLRDRLQDRFYAQARTHFPEAGDAYIRTVFRDFVLNLEYSCKKDAGRTTSGKWACYWNSTYDTYEKCQ